MENKQTAIEWLKDMLEWNYGDPQMLEISWQNLDDLLEQAKQMEKDKEEKFKEEIDTIHEYYKRRRN